MKIVIFKTLESTNDYLKQNYKKYDHFTAVRALKQTKGRGRFERIWESGDDLTVSFVFFDNLAYHFIIPLAINEVLKEKGLNTKIKWPNDILVDGVKISGVLIEKIFENFNAVTIVGIGLNFSFKEQYNYLNKYNIFNIEEILYDISRKIKLFSKYKLEDLKKLFLVNSNLLGREITQENSKYVVTDINDNGGLIARSNNKEIVIDRL